MKLKGNSEIYIDELIWDYETSLFINEPINVGDKILFLPCLYFDHYEASSSSRTFFSHIVANIYEFNFRPIKRFKSNLHKGCYHYLFEVDEDLTVFHFNFTKKYKDYLQVNQYYSGFGELRCSAGDPSQANSFIDSGSIKQITQKGIIDEIFVAYNFIWDSSDHPLSEFGYPEDFKKFKSLSKLLKPIRLTSTKETDGHGKHIVFKVSLIR